MTIESARPEDRRTIERLLEDSGLPLDGLADHWDDVLVTREGGRLIGCAGVEYYGPSCIVRSLAVVPGARGRGAGRALLTALLERARARGCTDAYGLTNTAERMLRHLGFARIEREEVPEAARASREFTASACLSAAVMHRSL